MLSGEAPESMAPDALCGYRETASCRCRILTNSAAGGRGRILTNSATGHEPIIACLIAKRAVTFQNGAVGHWVASIRGRGVGSGMWEVVVRHGVQLRGKRRVESCEPKQSRARRAGGRDREPEFNCSRCGTEIRP